MHAHHSPALLPLLLPIECDGKSQDGTDESGLVGDGGAGIRHDVTDGDDTDDRANTSAECTEERMTTPSPLHNQVSTFHP